MTAITFVTLNIGGSAQALLRPLHLWPEPDTVTELYFTHADVLPRTIRPNETAPVDFSIRNNGDSAITYHYTVSQTTSGTAEKSLASGDITVDGHDTIEKSLPVVPTLVNLDDTKIAVKITYPPDKINTSPKAYEISYWIKAKGE